MGMVEMVGWHWGSLELAHKYSLDDIVVEWPGHTWLPVALVNLHLPTVINIGDSTENQWKCSQYVLISVHFHWMSVVNTELHWSSMVTTTTSAWKSGLLPFLAVSQLARCHKNSPMKLGLPKRKFFRSKTGPALKFCVPRPQLWWGIFMATF